MAATNIPAFDLREYDDAFARVKVSHADCYCDIPDGVYHAVSEDVRLTETMATALPVVIWSFRITGPQAVHRVLYKNRVITESTLVLLKEDLAKCGLSLERLSDLPRRIPELRGRKVILDKRTRDGRAEVNLRWREKPSPADSPSRTVPL